MTFWPISYRLTTFLYQPMKLEPDHPSTQAIQSAQTDWIQVAGERIAHSVILGSHGEREPWQCETAQALSEAHFEQICAFKPELVIFGSGARQQFVHPRLYQSLIAAGIGIETMDTLAACRTYNVLASEDRHVIAALIIEPEPAMHM
jgi:uncharacterized protein